MAQAIRRAQAVYVDEWDDALIAEVTGGERGRAEVLLSVVESLGHALRAWVAFGHSPDAIVGYFSDGGALGTEHARAAELVATLRGEYERQAADVTESEA